MNITINHVDGITVVEVPAKLDAKTSPEVQEALESHIDENSRLILNMQNVTYMSSAGLRILLLLYREVEEKGGRLILSAVADNLQDTMSVTGFIDYFTLRDSYEDALAELRK
jgi:anti-sigma B factor antagonist